MSDLEGTLEHARAPTGGLFSRKTSPCIDIYVQRSVEAMAIIKRAGLEDHVIYEPRGNSVQAADMQFEQILVKYVIRPKGWRLVYDDEATARREEEKIRQGLTNLKALIDQNRGPLVQKKT